MAAGAQRPSAGRPNVVLMIADDQTWTDSGAYGNSDVPTPNIDRLAREGMLFTHAFTGTAMCSPTRQQLYSGIYPVRSGAYPNHSFVLDGTKSLVHHFRALGYRVGLTGKTHFGPPESFPFNVVGDAIVEGPTSVSAPSNVADVDLEAARAFIMGDESEPFFLVMASHDPHSPWTQGDASQFDREKLTVPPYLIDTPEMRETLARYYAEITHLDTQIGAVLTALDEAGVAHETIVIYTSEQGASFPFGKWTLYDTGLRTALIVRWPGHIRAGSRSDALVQYVDVVPTLLAAAGSEAVAGLDGKSFLPVLSGDAAEHRDYVYGVHTNRGIIYGNDYPIRSVRDRRYRLIWNLRPDVVYRNVITVAPSNSVLASWQKKAEAGDAQARVRHDAYLQRPEWELYDLQIDPVETPRTWLTSLPWQESEGACRWSSKLGWSSRAIGVRYRERGH